MSMTKNVKTSKGGASTGGVGAPMTKGYTTKAGRNNLKPPPASKKGK